MVTPNYEDERFKSVEAEENAALAEVENTYTGMIDASKEFYQGQINASKEQVAALQAEQQAQSDFAIEQIEQQKNEAKKDYTKEQSGAYVDWQKESNRYGVNAEQMAAQGLSNTGYSESSQVAMYNTYQNRVATAREGYNNAVLNYNNAIKEARLQNSSALAEIAYQGFQQQLELAMQGFQYENQLLSEKTSQKAAINNTYYNRYQDVLDQINYENQLKLDIQNAQNEANGEMIIDKNVEDTGGDTSERAPVFTAPVGAQADLPAVEIKNGALVNPVTGETVKLPFLSNTDKAVLSLLEKERAENSNKNGSKDAKEPTIMPKTTQAVLKLLDEKRKSGEIAKLSPGRVISTPYYNGAINSDTKLFGTFANGYQPKGILGHGKVSKTGDTIEFETTTLDGQTKTVKQNVWKTEDGKLWYWEGRENKYKELSK